MPALPPREPAAPDTLILPFAAGPVDDQGRPLAPPPPLPQLAALLAELTPAGRDEDEPDTLLPPHERALARAWGWPLDPGGALPLAAAAAEDAGLALDPALPWGLLQPVSWEVGREHVRMGDPAAVDEAPDTARRVFEVVQPLFASEGWHLVWGGPSHWYLGHPSLDGLATASADRVIGRNPDRWMPGARAARVFRRLQAEVQMSLHTHPLNEERAARGLPALNSVWLSGCGRARPRRPGVQCLDALRAPALRQDVDAWRAAWQALDAGPLAAARARLRAGAPLSLLLCGERAASAHGPARCGWLQRLPWPGRRPDPATLLGTL